MIEMASAVVGILAALVFCLIVLAPINRFNKKKKDQVDDK